MDLDFLKKFIKQTNTGSLKTKEYPNEFLDLRMRVSFGEGTLAKIPWISFRKTVSDGYNPVYLFYKEEGLLILSYGIMEKRKPVKSWDENIHETKTKISDYIDNPWRYGDSYIHKHYEPRLEGGKVGRWESWKVGRLSSRGAESMCKHIYIYNSSKSGLQIS